MNYDTAVKFLFEQLPMYQNKGQTALKTGLEGITTLLKELGNPHEHLKMIHIGGTNGKGSTCHILSALLQEHGFKIGLYSSPHYLDYRERIKINAELIPKDKVVSYVSEYYNLIEKGQYSFFEWSFAFSLLYFLESKVDYAIIEVGMGGRLDSTNIIQPILTGITNIGLDHTKFLGDTLEQIAAEKAGIMKERTPIVIGEKQNHSAACFKKVAKENKAPLVYADQMVDIIEFSGGKRISFSIQGENFESELDLLGKYQEDNLKMALALYRIFCLEEDLYMMEAEGYKNSLSSVASRSALIGRMQTVSKNPTVILDSAHNYDGFQSMFESIDQLEYDKLFLILGMVSDKDHDHILSLIPRETIVFVSPINVIRTEDVTKLNAIVGKYVNSHSSTSSIKEAYLQATNLAADSDLILVCGSIFTVGEWMDNFQESPIEIIN